MKSVVIITPTIGSDHLVQCVDSVFRQTYKNVRHLVVVDGQEANHRYCYKNNITIMSHLAQLGEVTKLTPIMLPDNVGANGWYGHRVYAAFTYLVNEDYIIYLDEDNWLEPNHVESLIEQIELGKTHWAFSLRNICNKEGEFICRDNCENLGIWPGVDGHRHVDTSCYCVSREMAIKVAHNWYGKWGADRQFFSALYANAPCFNTVGDYTLNYRLDGNPGSPKKEFFLQGNQIMEDYYTTSGYSKLPWERKDV